MTSKLGLIYNKLTDFYYQPKAIDDIQINNDIFKLIESLKEYKLSKCGPTNKELSCRIDDNDIQNISKFLAHIIPKCDKINISLEDIRNGKIISKGAFGYGFSTKNNVIKIIICKDIKFNEQVNKEIEINKLLTIIDIDIFTKLLGFFKREDDYNYKYYNFSNITNKYETENCDFKLNYDKMCETYLFLEKGKDNLENLVKQINYYDNGDKINLPDKLKNILTLNIISKFEHLLTIYKTTFKLNGNIFIHSDIKTANIIIVSDDNEDKFKFIDFGTSFVSNNFFNNAIGGTPNIFKLLVDDSFSKKKYIPDDIVVSPLYDLFCILYSLFEIVIGRKVVNMGGLRYSVNLILLEHPINDEYLLQKQKLYRMFYLLDMIHNFYYSIMRDYENYRSVYDSIYNNDNKSYLNKQIYKLITPLFSRPTVAIDPILNFFDMENFNLIETDYFVNTGLDFANVPIYDKLYDNKLKNDIIYLDRIMCYLFESIKPEEYINF